MKIDSNPTTDSDPIKEIDRLPECCFTVTPSTGELVSIKKGTIGYFPSTYNRDNVEENKNMANLLNNKLGNSRQQIAAMINGSFTNWNEDNPLINPNNYDAKGKYLKFESPKNKMRR